MQIPTNLHSYWLLLKDLSAAEKRSLIGLLVDSIKSESTVSGNKKDAPLTDDDWVLRFAGSWNDFPETAEEMISLIEGARTTSRPVERL